MNINKELLNGDKLTKRAMQNQRSRLAKLGTLCGNLIEGVLNRSLHCEKCTEEFDPGNTISKVELDTIKLVYAKTLSDVSAQDFNDVSDEVKTQEEQAASILTILSSKAMLESMITSDYNKTKELAAELTVLTETNVRDIKSA